MNIIVLYLALIAGLVYILYWTIKNIEKEVFTKAKPRK